jgi:integrase
MKVIYFFDVCASQDEHTIGFKLAGQVRPISAIKQLFALRSQFTRLMPDQRAMINGKTAESDKDIPVNEATFRLLSNLCEKRKSEFVFPSTRKIGERLLDPKVGFMKAVRLAGIPHIRFHDLRHTFSTRLVRTGVDLVTIQHLLGAQQNNDDDPLCSFVR